MSKIENKKYIGRTANFYMGEGRDLFLPSFLETQQPPSFPVMAILLKKHQFLTEEFYFLRFKKVMTFFLLS